MAHHLANIYGSEQDKVNCSFYIKVGACRHGDKCSRNHNKPTFSQTVLLKNLYLNPLNSAQSADGSHYSSLTMEQSDQHFNDFYEDIFVELWDKYGEIEEMKICDNLGEHLVGNCYVKFFREEDAQKAMDAVNNRWCDGRAVNAELSPVTDFKNARCRQYEESNCDRSRYCNYMHYRPISDELNKYLFGKSHHGGGGGGGGGSSNYNRRRRSRSRSVDRHRRDRSRSHDRNRRRRSRSNERNKKRKSRSMDKSEKKSRDGDEDEKQKS